METITQKELKVIDSISRNNDISQRDIADESGVSLGLANILINRLVKKGYVKARKLNARKIRYMVTPKGLKEKTSKTYNFMKRSLSVIEQLKSIITEFALKKYNEGTKEFVIVGQGELSEITELVLKSLQLDNLNIRRQDEINSFLGDCAIFNATRYNSYKLNSSTIDIWKKAETLYGSSYEF